MESSALIAIAVFLITYAFIISEKIHRTIISMIGAVALIAFGVLDQESALHHIDFNTIGLLIGMMIIVGITAETGVFEYIAVWGSQKVKAQPLKILIVLNLFTAVASAFLDNVTTVLLVVPVTLSITKQLRVNPIPFLISEIFSSNIGGTSTMIGDPPNIMIGSAVSDLTFLAFIDNLAIVSTIILIVTIAIFTFIYRHEFKTSDELKNVLMQKKASEEILDPILLRKSLFAIFVTISGFFAHQFIHIETATIALFGAFLLLLITGEKYLEKSLEKAEWTTLFFFIGLFVIVGGLVDTGLIALVAKKAMSLTGGDLNTTTLLILWMSAIVSAFVDNIPFVATMIPLVKEMGNLGITNLEPLWWSLSLGACLGGNGTLIGASANLVVAGIAAREGHRISFMQFLKIGFPLMLVSIVISTVYVYVRYLM
ncbi:MULTISPECIES: ArsB/NhaD family transporter [unclassified Bacillus (in: firmicutes)]|uniref:ArsB/NhaD family transporter n=1 Tax=unclassified Bacillus (in: firmicutes) TaxID=185979 RepID=UPI0008EB682B|nr:MULTISPECIES: ArsB/NhaD family transporter [unclassified Bacillus (in: firmicutes)]SFA91114.1 Na+/H+ antiporter NhaD [Bacillus sp. UNCCL13]SFQ85506.1 Na+/H+ antiporter NhaD [Bacillus sp. cl95]